MLLEKQVKNLEDFLPNADMLFVATCLALHCTMEL